MTTSRSRVLVVDDHPSVRQLFVTVLESEGFEALEADSGDAALALLEREAVDLILLDRRMPGRDGASTLTALRQRDETRLTPVVFVTGSGDVDDRIAGLNAGAVDYIVKPVSPEELVARVRAHLRERASLLSAIEEGLRSRAEIAALLADLDTAGDLSGSAEQICAHICQLDGIDACSIIVFPRLDEAEVLAASGSSVSADDRLPLHLTRRLQARALGEGWVEYRTRQPAGTSDVPLGPPEAEVAAFAPLRHGTTLGVLGVASAYGPKGTGTSAAAHCLSTTLDLAPVVTALIAPSLSRFRIEPARERMRDLISHQAFAPVFQPIIDLSDGAIAGYEALTRFTDGTSPQQRFAEAHRLDVGLDLEHATAAAAVRAAQVLPGDAWLAVNVTPTFLDDVGRLGDAVADVDRALVLEVTEHDPIADYDRVRAALDSLEDASLSVDDAGAGYACLQHVLALRPRFVKLDKSWITGIEQDPARQALVAGVASFTGQIGSTIIAEGVEREEERRMLERLGIPLAQGYLFAAPTSTA